MELKKPVITKEQAEAIEKTKKYKEEARILSVVAAPDNKWAGGYATVLNDMHPQELATALYVGYEIEKTPEQQVIDLYSDYIELSQEYGRGRDTKLHAHLQAQAVREAVAILRPDLVKELDKKTCGGSCTI